MLGVIDWCYYRAPKKIQEAGTYEVIDYSRDVLVRKYLRKHCKYDDAYIASMSIKELAELIPSEQYTTLLYHIFKNNPEDIDAQTMITYIDWMVSCRDLFETGLVAYIWCNSALNNLSKFPTHSKMLSAVDNGCDRDTLDFLWKVAKSGDMVLTDAVYVICESLDTPRYTKLISYVFMCSGCDEHLLSTFFLGIHNLTDYELECLTDYAMLYTWTTRSITKLLEKGYTMIKLYKMLYKLSKNTFISPGREFPYNKVRKKLRSIKIRHSAVFVSTLKCPIDYKMNYSLWSDEYKGYTPEAPVINMYEEWFKSLTSSQLEVLYKRNPVVYDACQSGKYKYVEPLLDNLMKSLEDVS